MRSPPASRRIRICACRRRPDGPIPKLLSQTGAFKDTPHLVPSDELLPYDLILPFWSDGAEKLRWIAVPAGKIEVLAERRVGLSRGYRVREDLRAADRCARSDAQASARDPSFDGPGRRPGVRRGLQMAAGPERCRLAAGWLDREACRSRTRRVETHSQTWDYPSRKDCITCHTKLSGGVLGVKTRQLNHDFAYPSGVVGQRAARVESPGTVRDALREADIQRLAAARGARRQVAQR